MPSTTIKVALRHLSKQKGFTAINIAGLAIGVACCLLILLFVHYELSFDRWNSQADRIFRPVIEIQFGGSHFNLAVVGSPVGPDLQREFPEILATCRFRDNGSWLVKRDGDAQVNIREEHVLYTDSTFFIVFPVKMLEGNPIRCLTQPNSLALSRSRAEKLFGSPQAALGQTLILDNNKRWKITGVYEDIPGNTHFRADILLAMNGNSEVKRDSPLWATSNNFQTYVLLRPDADPVVFEKKFLAFARQKINETSQRIFGHDISALEATGQFVRYTLQPLPSIHLYSDLNIELQPNGSIQHVWIFSAIAGFILLLACINFMNLTTARSARRAREIGVRKVLGSSRRALIRQFLGESVLMAGFAVTLAVLLAAAVMPWFADLTNRPIQMPWDHAAFWAFLAGGIGIVGLLAGIYPAFFLSAFDPIRTLKGTATRAGGASLRSALVVFQFATSIALIIATVAVYNQLHFIQQKKLGFQKDQVIILDNVYSLGDAVQAFKNSVRQMPGVSAVSVSGYLPVPSDRSDQTFSKVREFREDQSVNMQFWTVDQDYLKTMGMEMSSGRFFDPERFATDSAGMILNETAARLFGYAEPLGAKVYGLTRNVDGQPKPQDFKEWTVIGILKDFHFASLRDNIGPLCMILGDNTGRMAVRYESAATKNLLATLETQWQQTAPGQPFGYQFMDASFAGMYAAEQRIGRIAGIFALLSIFISCLGLFGLAAYTAERRTREIGIRRVLGASVQGIIGLMSRDFLKPVLLSLIFAGPFAWYFMLKWLQDFAYRATLSWWIFALAGGIALVIAFLTVSYQSWKASRVDPAEALRNE